MFGASGFSCISFQGAFQADPTGGEDAEQQRWRCYRPSAVLSKHVSLEASSQEHEERERHLDARFETLLQKKPAASESLRRGTKS